MSLISAAALLLNLVVFGAHAVVPMRIARGQLAPSRLWSLAAPAALALSTVVTVVAIGRAPDAAVAWGLADPLRISPVTGILAIAWGALLISDLVVVFGWRRMELAAWWPAAVIGLLAVAAHAFGSELLRAGWGPVVAERSTLLWIVILRVPLALAAGELLLGPPRLPTLIAGPALVVSIALWPTALLAHLTIGRATLGAAALLLFVARWTPTRLRRAAAILGIVLATMFLSRAAEVARILGTSETVSGDSIAP